MFASELEATIPNFGASGAISAVLGAYLVLLPNAKVLTIIFFILREVPAVLFLGIWFVFQLLDGSTSIWHTPRPAAESPSSPTSAASSSALLTVKLFQKRRRCAPAY